jgi:hypothetical protein
VAGDVGSTLRVVESVGSAGYNEARSTSDASPLVVAGDFTLITDATVNGTPAVGVATGLTPASITPAPDFVSFQWERCDSSGGNCSLYEQEHSQNSYTPVPQDVGSRLVVVETAVKVGYNDAQVTSFPSPVVVKGTITTNTPVAVIGTPKLGQALTLSPGVYSAGRFVTNLLTRSYQWEACYSSGDHCYAISGATSSSYTPVPVDVSLTLRVVETVSPYAGAGYNDGGSTSDATASVASGDMTLNTPVAVNGTPTVGVASGITQGTYSPTPDSFSETWERCDSSGANCAIIPVPPATTYVPGPDDVGSTLRVYELVMKIAYNSQVSTSAPSPVVVKGTITTTTPVAVSGTAEVGQTLTVSRNGVYSSACHCAVTRSYQWQRCGGTARCSNISGATSIYYTPVAADVGSRLHVVETVSAPGYNNGGSTSAATAVVAKGFFTIVDKVTIPFVPKVGTLTQISKGSYEPTPDARTYRWLRCTDTTLGSCVTISGATSATYKPVAADKGKRLRVVETVSKAGYNNASQTSSYSAKVT